MAKNLSNSGEDLLADEAALMVRTHSERALEIASSAAKLARNKRDHKRARHFSQVARKISELTACPAAPRHPDKPKPDSP